MCDDRPLFLYNAQKNLSSRFEAMLTLSIDLSTATHVNAKSILLIFDEDVLIHNMEASRAIRGHEQVNSLLHTRSPIFRQSLRLSANRGFLCPADGIPLQSHCFPL